MEKVLIIIRGISGCGKSTFANLIGSFICTADDYHIIDGKYDWKPENTGPAHVKCQKKVEWGMTEEISKIIVANTSTTVKELKPYYDLAEKYGYTVFSVIVENRHNGVSEHNVPEGTLNKMRERFNVQL